jgi:hypothetical protein
MKLNFFEKALVGGFSIKVGKKYVNFPKLGPFMTIAILLTGLFQEGSFKNIPFLFWTGMVMILIGFFSFFYFDIFPSRRPKNEEEAKSYINW